MILSVAMLFAWLGRQRGREDFSRSAPAIDRSVDTILGNPQSRTADLQGRMGCQAFASEVARAVLAS